MQEAASAANAGVEETGDEGFPGIRSFAAGDLGREQLLPEAWGRGSLSLRSPVALQTGAPSWACPWGLSRTAR